jgi:hypothetical protein
MTMDSGTVGAIRGLPPARQPKPSPTGQRRLGVRLVISFRGGVDDDACVPGSPLDRCSRCALYIADGHGTGFYHSGHTAIGFNPLCTLYPREQLGIVIFVNDDVDQDRVSEVERVVRAALH